MGTVLPKIKEVLPEVVFPWRLCARGSFGARCLAAHGGGSGTAGSWCWRDGDSRRPGWQWAIANRLAQPEGSRHRRPGRASVSRHVLAAGDEDWTLRAFCETKRGGLGVKVSGSQETAQALKAAMGKLLMQNLAALESLVIDGAVSERPDRSGARRDGATLAYGARSDSQEQGASWDSFVASAQKRYAWHLQGTWPMWRNASSPASQAMRRTRCGRNTPRIGTVTGTSMASSPRLRRRISFRAQIAIRAKTMPMRVTRRGPDPRCEFAACGLPRRCRIWKANTAIGAPHAGRTGPRTAGSGAG